MEHLQQKGLGEPYSKTFSDQRLRNSLQPEKHKFEVLLQTEQYYKTYI